jgi:hypothetical protein
MSKSKDVATNPSLPKEEALEKFRLLLKKTALTRQSKTCLQHISRLVEFIENTPIFDNLRFKFTKEKEEGELRLHSLELQVYNKSKMAYDTLKSRLIDQKLIDLPEIELVVVELETLFASNEPNCSPVPWQPAFDGVKTLGMILEKMDRTDLLKDLADLRTMLVRSQPSNSLEFVTEEKLVVDHFTFAEGVIELTKLQNDFYFKIEKTPWAIWEKFLAIRWCFKTPFTYWKNKRLRYSSRFYRKESWQRLNLHAMWGEVNKIKNRSTDVCEFLIQKKQLIKYLEKFSIEVQDYLNTYQPIEQLNFFLQGECLWIVMKIAQTTNPYQYFMIKELRELKNLYKFVRTLSQTNSLASIDVPDGYSSSSLLSHLNMPLGSNLALLFFNGWSPIQVHFKGNLVKGNAIRSQVYIPHLIDDLKKLHERHKTRFFSLPIESFFSKDQSKASKILQNR